MKSTVFAMFHNYFYFPLESISDERPVDCDDIDSRPSGVYTIYPKGSADPLKVFCFMQADGGGWTVSKSTISITSDVQMEI